MKCEKETGDMQSQSISPKWILATVVVLTMPTRMWGLTSPLECGLDLSDSCLTIEKGTENNSAVEKPGRYHLNSKIKVNIPSNKSS